MNKRREHHVVALSGGKDSTAMALRLKEVEPREYTYICTPTGDELPEMEAHWARLESLLGAELIRLQTDDHDTLKTLIDAFQALPNNRMRWCTRILKIEPCITYMEQNGPGTLYVGLRADEPADLRAGGVYDKVDGYKQRFPLREWGWSIDVVWRFLCDRRVDVPWRTDCARCYHQRLPEWYNLWLYHPEVYNDAMADEASVTKARGREHTFRNATRDTWPASLYALAEEFKAGRIPQGVDLTPDMFGGNSGICRVCSL